MSLNDLGFLSTPTVLVIDDDPDVCEYLAFVMGPWATVLTAHSGDEGLRLCRQTMPDLVLLDVQMPGLDGFDVINEIKHDSTIRHIPVMFITGETFTEVESECLEAGASDYVAKPINSRVLAARVRTLILLKQQADRLSELAVVDGLTGTMTRRAFDERVMAESNRARRSGETLSLVIVDVEDFAGYNVMYGHLAGDEALRSVVEAARAVARRQCDVLARFSPGQVAVLLPDTSADEAALLASRMVDAVTELAIPFRGSATGRLNVRAGIADSAECADVTDLVAQACRVGRTGVSSCSDVAVGRPAS